MYTRIILCLTINLFIIISVRSQTFTPPYENENDPHCKEVEGGEPKTECEGYPPADVLNETRPSYYPPSEKLQEMYREERERMREEDDSDPFDDIPDYHFDTDYPEEANSKRSRGGRRYKQERNAAFQRYARARTRDFWIRNGDKWEQIKTSATKKGLKEVLKRFGNKILHLPGVDFFWPSTIGLDYQERLYLQWDVQTAINKVDFFKLSIVYYQYANMEERNTFDKLYQEALYDELNNISCKIYDERAILRTRTNISPSLPTEEVEQTETNRAKEFQHNFIPSGPPPPPRRQD